MVAIWSRHSSLSKERTSMKSLCLLTNGFPYGNWEPYLETEEKYYSKFKTVTICSLQIRKDQGSSIRELRNSNINIIPVKYTKKWIYLLNSVRALFDTNLYKEIRKLLRSKRLSASRLISLFVFLSRAHYESRIILKSLSEDKIDLFYSYRFEYQTYVAILLKKKTGLDVPIIARAHGYDLYEERSRNNYIPLREIVLNSIDRVYPCSKAGELYLKEKYEEYQGKIYCRYLGTLDHGTGPVPKRNGHYRIVSCSNVIPIKNLELLAKALSLITDLDIEWIHFGAGPLLEALKTQCAHSLPKNINASFLGNIDNEALMEFYSKNEIDLFVNVSLSEGIPVSIMEAFSFGIPCLATDVGGTKELVDEKCGELVNSSCSADYLATSIEAFLKMPLERYLGYRKACRSKWGTCFNASDNYEQFINELLGIAEAGRK